MSRRFSIPFFISTCFLLLGLRLWPHRLAAGPALPSRGGLGPCVPRSRPSRLRGTSCHLVCRKPPSQDAAGTPSAGRPADPTICRIPTRRAVLLVCTSFLSYSTVFLSLPSSIPRISTSADPSLPRSGTPPLYRNNTPRFALEPAPSTRRHTRPHHEGSDIFLQALLSGGFGQGPF
ncbi:hypothetical protein C8J57DRAFT_1713451 [Mycena rebaudengoi]|nr:hypothetical protein C8J57DRAFT_1713451 [Mycena rebaudengoi]